MTSRTANKFILALLAAMPECVLAQPEPTKVVVVKAEMREAPASITLVGTVEPVRRSRVGSEIAGIVAEMPVRQGDRVSEGDILCRLDSEALRYRMAEAKARLGALRARHEELLAGTRKEELTRLQALLDEASADFDRWKFEMDRIDKLYEGRDSNDKEFYDTRAEYLTAERRKVAAQANYNLGLEGPRKEVISQAGFEVAEQVAVVNRIESDLRKTTITAPFDGYIVTRDVEIGEWVPAGGQVVEMTDLSSVLVRANVPEAAFPYVSVGLKTRVKIDALKRIFEGQVKHIMRQADLNARTLPVEIELDNREGLLAGGMFARTTLTSGEMGAVVAVPKDAIFEKDGVTHVATVLPGQRGGMLGMLMGVTVGADVGDWAAITSGNVRPGMPVITRGNENIEPFPTPVIIVDEKGNPVNPPRGDTEMTRKGGG
jgi:multidrug efflux pump subunit AcrA (membrane-fusion protein)